MDFIQLDPQTVAIIIYGVFLFILLVINLLYFFQVFRYRLPGDISLPILVLHSILLAIILLGSSIYLTNLG